MDVRWPHSFRSLLGLENAGILKHGSDMVEWDEVWNTERRRSKRKKYLLAFLDVVFKDALHLGRYLIQLNQYLNISFASVVLASHK